MSDTIDAGADAKIIVARAAQPLALGPLLPLGVARYILLRGLPEDASLSAGRRTGAGTWMVKGEDIAGLTLTFGDGARGDYPTEIYLLDSQAWSSGAPAHDPARRSEPASLRRRACPWLADGLFPSTANPGAGRERGPKPQGRPVEAAPRQGSAFPTSPPARRSSQSAAFSPTARRADKRMPPTSSR